MPKITTSQRRIASVLFVVSYFLLHQPLFADSTDQSSKTPNVYATLARVHVPSLAKQEAKENEINQERAAHNAEQLNQAAQNRQTTLDKIEVSALGNVEALKLLYTMFQNHGCQSTATLPEATLHDLEILCGPSADPEHHLFKKIDYTVTNAGKIELQKMLVQPATNIATLQARQAAIKELIANEQLFNEAEKYLAQIKANEAELVSFWKNMDEATAKFFEQAYFGKFCWIDFSWLNKSSTALGAMSLWKLFLANMYATIQAPLKYAAFKTFFGVGTIALAKWLVPDDKRLANMQIPPLTSTFWYDFKNIYSQPLAQTVTTYNGTTFESFVIDTKANPYAIKIAAGILLVTLFFTFFNLRSSINEARSFNTISNMIQQKMIAAATCVNAARSLTDLIAKNPVLAAGIPVCSAAPSNNTTDQEAAELTESLATDTFKGEPSLLSNKGRVLYAYKQMLESKNQFVQTMQTAGQLDAYLSIAKLYNSQKNNPKAAWCFVSYDASTVRPYLNVEKFWHPMLNPAKVVTNSIELGNGARNGIVTGPNAGGKSTALTAIALNVLLSQTLGIAAAHSMTMTPFSTINTYLNIVDSKGELSLFQAEMKRAKELKESLEALHQDEFNFMIMDELYTGTNPEDGTTGAYNYAQRLADFTNSIAILSTHYKRLTTLEKDTNGLFQNYKVSVDIKPSGKITSTYLFEKGISDQTIGLQLLQNAGLGRITKEA